MRSLWALWDSLSRGRLSRGVITLVGGTTVAQVIVVGSSPALTRLYSPDDLGAYAVATSVLSILLAVTCLRYDWAIPLPEQDVLAADLLGLCLVATLCTSLAAAVALWLAGPSLLALLGAPTLSPYIPLLILGQLGGGVVLALTGWAIRTKNFSGIASSRLSQTGTLVLLQLGLGVAHSGVLGLLLGAVAGSISGSSRLARTAWRTHASSFRRVSQDGIRAAARRYRRFPIFSTGSALLNAIGVQAPLLAIVALHGTAEGGQYALAQRVAALPVTLVAAAVAQVFVAESARLVREQASGMRRLFGRTTGRLAVFAIGPFALLAVTAPVLGGLVFGHEWRQAGFFVAILAPMFYLQLVTSPTGGTLDVLERQDLALARELLRLGFVGGAVLIAAAMKLNPIEAVFIFSGAGCLTYSSYGLISWRAIVVHDRRHPPGPR